MRLNRRSKKACACSLDDCSLEIRNLDVTLNRIRILEDVSFDVRCGEVTAVIGPNGAGKSTLLKAILGVIPYDGCIHFCHRKSHGGGAPRIGYIPQQLNFDRSMPLKVFELFSMASPGARPSFSGVPSPIREKAATALASVKAEHLLDKRVGGLSGGEIQRVLFALAINPLPNILIMDEPISGVDVSGEALIYELIRKMRGNIEMSVIIVSHDLSMVTSYTDHVVCINRRVVCQGAADDILTPKNIEETFGSYIGMYRHHASHDVD